MRAPLAWFAILIALTASGYAGPIELRGDELEAFSVAQRDFRAQPFSVSGDLRHYSVTFERKFGAVEIVFFPDEAAGPAPPYPRTGSGTKYGMCVTYLVSLKHLKILRKTFSR